MSEHIKDTLLALLFAGLGILVLMWALSGCATPNQPFPEGEVVPAPWGYMKHCIIYEGSIYCEEFPDDPDR